MALDGLICVSFRDASVVVLGVMVTVAGATAFDMATPKSARAEISAWRLTRLMGWAPWISARRIVETDTPLRSAKTWIERSAAARAARSCQASN